MNLLNILDYGAFEVDLLLFSREGIFISQVPKEVNLINLNSDFRIFQKSLLISVLIFFLKGKFNLGIARFLFSLKNRLIKNKAVAEQQSWKYIRKCILPLEKHYDSGIAYLEKSSIYFLVDFVNAKKKIGYIHNDYDKLTLDFEFDKYYFSKLDNIVTVSEECKVVLNKKIASDKINVIYNIVSSKLLNRLASEKLSVSNNESKLKLLSIGRLHKQKGFDLAIQTAKILKNNNIDFVWDIIGDGTEKESLKKLIKKNKLNSEFRLLGLKENPYPYLKNCNFYIQPSRYEGKAIAIDEALVLKKIIIATDFSTAKDQIIDGVNGFISEMKAEMLAKKIIDLINNKEAIMKIENHLIACDYDNTSEIENFYKLING